MTEFHSTIDDERRNFRVPVQEKSFLYPVDGSWKGRRAIETIDLSCGGISFYSDSGMNSGDIAEVVIPMTANPLLLQIKLLRKDEVTAERARYAAKFVALQPEEDQMICEAVFNIQLQNRSRKKTTEEMEG